MPLTQGQNLNKRYRIAKLLAQGGFGTVYRAWDLNLEKLCAVKENRDTSPEAQKQFRREARILSDLGHPHLPGVIDHFILPDQGQYLVMQFVEGEDLRQMLDRLGGPLPLERALLWIGQICDALIYLHSQPSPIIHRDIKPANIRITSGGATAPGKAVLVDFGIAKWYDPGQVTASAARAVTSGFSPPEQYGMRSTDALSDQYSLAATLYHLLTGHIPPDAIDLLSRVVSAPTPVHEINPAVPSSLSMVIGRGMSLDRDQRFPSVEAFKNALLKAVTPAPTHAQAAADQQVSAPTAATAQVAANLLPTILNEPAPATVKPAGLNQASQPSSDLGVAASAVPAIPPQSQNRNRVKIYAAIGIGGFAGILILGWLISSLLSFVNNQGGKINPSPVHTTIPAFFTHTPRSLTATATQPSPGTATLTSTNTITATFTPTLTPTYSKTPPLTNTPIITVTSTPTQKPVKDPDIEITNEVLPAEPQAPTVPPP